MTHTSPPQHIPHILSQALTTIHKLTPCPHCPLAPTPQQVPLINATSLTTAPPELDTTILAPWLLTPALLPPPCVPCHHKTLVGPATSPFPSAPPPLPWPIPYLWVTWHDWQLPSQSKPSPDCSPSRKYFSWSQHTKQHLPLGLAHFFDPQTCLCPKTFHLAQPM